MFWHFSPASSLTKSVVSQGSSGLAGLFSHTDGARRQLDVAFTAISGCSPPAGSLGSRCPPGPQAPGS